MKPISITSSKSFHSTVIIPRAGDNDGVLDVVFRDKGRSHIVSLDKLVNDVLDKSKDIEYVNQNDDYADYLMSIIESWGLPDELSRDNIIKLLDNYPRAFDAIVLNYAHKIMCLPVPPNIQLEVVKS